MVESSKLLVCFHGHVVNLPTNFALSNIPCPASTASQSESVKTSCMGSDCLVAAAPAELGGPTPDAAAPPSRVISFGPMTHSAFTRMVAKKRSKLAATLKEQKLAEVVISRKAAAGALPQGPASCLRVHVAPWQRKAPSQALASCFLDTVHSLHSPSSHNTACARPTPAATSESAFPSVDDLDGSILHAEPIPMPAPSQPAATCAAGSIPAPGGAGCVKLPSPTTPQADFTMENEPMTPSPAPTKRTSAPASTNAHADFTMEYEPMTPSPAPKERAAPKDPRADFTMEFEPMTPAPAPGTSNTTTTTTTTTTSVLGAIRKLRTQEEAEAEEREAVRRSPAAQVVGSTQWRNRVAREQHQRQQARDALTRTGADANSAASVSSSSSGGSSSSRSGPRGGSGSSKFDKARGRADEAAIAAGLKAGPMPASSRPVGQAGKGKGKMQPKKAASGRSAMPAASRPVRSAAEEVPKSLLDKFGRPKGTGRSASRSA